MKQGKKTREFDFVNYLKKINFTINNLRKKRDCKDNFLVGGFPCSVIEFLGSCLRYDTEKKKPREKNQTKKRFRRFFKEFLPKYYKWEFFIRNDLRHGVAHLASPKGFVVLSYSEDAKKFHISRCQKLVRDPNTDKYHLILYSPQFLRDLSQAIKFFIHKLKENKKLERNCVKRLERLSREGQDLIGLARKKRIIYKKDLNDAIEESIERDTFIK